MLTEEQARGRVEELLRERGRHRDGGLTVLREHTVELPYGWMFTYASTRYAPSGATEHAIDRYPPVVVIAETGEIVNLGTGLSPGEELDRFERARGLEQPVPPVSREMQPFAKSELDTLSPADRLARCSALGDLLTLRIRTARNFHSAVRAAVSELRALGHDLWSFDESDDFEIWCPNYAQPSGPSLVLTFHTDEVVVEWSKN